MKYLFVFLFLLSIHFASSQDCSSKVFYICSKDGIRCDFLKTLPRYKDSLKIDINDFMAIEICAKMGEMQFKDFDIDIKELATFTHIESYSTPNIIKIPSFIGNFKKLKKIVQYPILGEQDFFRNTIFDIPTDLWELSKLEWVALYTNKIPARIENLTQLKHLNICNTSELPLSLPSKDSWSKLKNLNTVILHSAQMPSEVFVALAPLQSLQKFDLTTKANIKGFIDSCLQILANNAATLTAITLNVNTKNPTGPLIIHNEPDDGTGQNFILKNNYPVLEKLLLKHCSLIDFSADAAQFPKLTTLDLSFNRLRNFNLKVADSSSIKHLNLSYNFLTTLPNTLLQLTSLEILDLHDNRIVDLPLGLEHLPNLKEIRIDDRIPPTILANLQKRFGQKLIVWKNRYIDNYDYWMKDDIFMKEYVISLELPDKFYDYKNEELDKFQFVLKNKPFIKKLWLQQNIFSKFPTRILTYKNLLELDISFNLLTNIPRQIKNLKALKTLNLSQNYIQELPESFGKLEQVQRLNLSFNLLKTLPKSIGELQELEHLGLVNNPLETLPIELKKLQKIKTIYISNDLDKALKDLLVEWFGKDKISISCNRTSFDFYENF